MRKILFAAVLFFLILPFQKVSSQTENNFDEEIMWLRSDLKVADVVVFVDVKIVKFADSTAAADCENNTGNGYCSYLLMVEVKEIFKGKIESRTLEFYIGAEATYPKRNFLGERIYFLVWSEEEKDKSKRLFSIENSTRPIDALKTMRKITNPLSPIDENNESEPYSLKAIEKEFETADAVIYANVTSFKPDKDNELGSFPFVLEAKIKEVFKGDLKAGQKFEYRDDLLYRPIRKEDLGEQILYLEKKEEDGKVFYKRISYTIGDIEHDILEKLRKIPKR